jgi:hypothetical protein
MKLASLQPDLQIQVGDSLHRPVSGAQLAIEYPVPTTGEVLSPPSQPVFHPQLGTPASSEFPTVTDNRPPTLPPSANPVEYQAMPMDVGLLSSSPAPHALPTVPASGDDTSTMNVDVHQPRSQDPGASVNNTLPPIANTTGLPYDFLSPGFQASMHSSLDLDTEVSLSFIHMSSSR